jgi:NADPH-dependent 2,4-dienoyl-CoA reductase/sulfur reductase-like enzyme
MKRIGCDLVACGFHLVANSELPAAFGCVLAEDKVKVDDWQRTSEPAIYSAGESTGIGGLDLALIEGQIAGFAAAGERDRATRLFGKRTALTQWTRALEHAFALRPELRHLVQADTIICRCEDVRWSALAGQRSFRLAKLYTRCGMGPCQGRICGAALRFLSGWKNDFTRPPVYPVRLSTLIREPQSLLTANPGSGNVRGREAGTASLVGNKENP